MSFTSRLQKKLKDYIQCDDPEAREQLKRELWKELPNPHFVTKCHFIPKDHTLKREAWIISDAFEAVTNGMFSPELSEELKTIKEEDFFFPWMLLTQGIQAFYACRFHAACSFIKMIPPEAAPTAFTAFFSAVAENTTIPEEWKKLEASVIDDKGELKSSLDQLTEAASAGMEDLLLETAAMMIKDMIREHPEAAAKILMWCFYQLQELDILSDKAVEKAQSLFGHAEGLRLTALATLSYDQDRSLVYWLQALQAYLEDNYTTRVEVKAYLDIIRDVSETVSLEFELTKEYLSLLMTHLTSLIASLTHLYPDMTQDITKEEFEAHGAVMHILQTLAGKKEKGLAPSHKKTIQNTTTPVQLELFAF